MDEEEENLFPLFHLYNRLVRRKMVQPLKCNCGQAQVTTAGAEDELVLTCFACGATTVPGLDTVNNVRAVVSEHFMEED